MLEFENCANGVDVSGVGVKSELYRLVKAEDSVFEAAKIEGMLGAFPVLFSGPGGVLLGAGELELSLFELGKLDEF